MIFVSPNANRSLKNEKRAAIAAALFNLVYN